MRSSIQTFYPFWGLKKESVSEMSHISTTSDCWSIHYNNCTSSVALSIDYGYFMGYLGLKVSICTHIQI